MTRMSICVPVYRAEPRHLTDLLNSIGAQTRRPDQVVLTEDPSGAQGVVTADLPDIGIPVVLVRNRERLGMSGNWNRSVEVSDGDIVLVTGQDDILSPAACETHCRALAETFSGLSTSLVAFIDDEGRPRRTEQKSVTPDRIFGREGQRVTIHFPQLVDLSLVYGNVTGEPCGTAFSRSAFLGVNGYSRDYEHAVDQEFVLRVARATGSVTHTNTVLSARRLHWNNVSRAHITSGAASRDRHRLVEEYVGAATSGYVRRRAEARLVVHDVFDGIRARSLTQALRPLRGVSPRLLPSMVTDLAENAGLPPTGRRWVVSSGTVPGLPKESLR